VEREADKAYQDLNGKKLTLTTRTPAMKDKEVLPEGSFGNSDTETISENVGIKDSRPPRWGS